MLAFVFQRINAQIDRVCLTLLACNADASQIGHAAFSENKCKSSQVQSQNCHPHRTI